MSYTSVAVEEITQSKKDKTLQWHGVSWEL